MPFAAQGRPGEVDKEAAEEEEERRHEEARERAEAEQAALEQLKEENPEAYAKPVREEEGEEGEEGEGPRAKGGEEADAGGPRPRAPRTKRWTRRRTRTGSRWHGKDFTEGAQSAHAEVQDARLQPLPPVRRSRAYYRKFGLCRICLREAAHKGYVPGMTKSSW